jgi:hypothetical protein
MSRAMPDSAPADARPAADPTYVALRRRRNLFGALALFFLGVMIVTGLLDAATTVREDRSFTVGPSPRLVLRNDVSGGLRGGIEVRAGDADRLNVNGKVHATWRVRYVLEQRGDDVVIDVRRAHPRRARSARAGAVRGDRARRHAARRRDAPRPDHRAGDRGRRHAALEERRDPPRRRRRPSHRHHHQRRDRRRRSRGTFDLATTNGKIVLDAELEAGERHRVVTTNGEVRVRLRGEPSLRVDARTVNGAVVARRPIEARERAGNALAGTIGSGEGELSLRTTNGAVVIE